MAELREKRAGSSLFLKKSKFYRALFLIIEEITEKKAFLKFLKRTNFKHMWGTKIYCWGETKQIRQLIEEEAIGDHEVIDYRAF